MNIIKKRTFTRVVSLVLSVMLLTPILSNLAAVEAHAADTNTLSFRCEPVDILYFGTYWDNIDYDWREHPEKYFKKASDVLDPVTLNIDSSGKFSVNVPKTREMVHDDNPKKTRGPLSAFTMTGQLCYGDEKDEKDYQGGGLFFLRPVGDKKYYTPYHTKNNTGKCSPASLSFPYTNSKNETHIGTFVPDTCRVRTHVGDLKYSRGESSERVDDVTAVVSIYLYGVLYDVNGKVFDDTVKFQLLYEAKNIPQKVEEKPKDGELVFFGWVKNASGERMKGLDMCVQGVFDDSPDIAFCENNCSTDKEGKYKVRFTVPADVKNPAVKVKLRLQYLSSDRSELINFIDDCDSKSKKDKEITITTVVHLKKDKIAALKKGGSVYNTCVLDFKGLLGKTNRIQFLSLTPNDYTTNLQDDISVKFSEGTKSLSAAERLADASILYNAAVDAHTFACEKLGEKNTMSRDITVKLRSSAEEDPTSAHYSPDEFCVHLGADTSLRDDDSICTVLHEFGHAVDHLTSGNRYFHLNSVYDSEKEKWLDQNHFGIFNYSMNDSYTEGFASFYAALVRKYTGRENPEKLVRSDLSLSADNYAYNPTRYGTSYEETAISSFLYNAENTIGDVKKMWSVLKPDRDCFRNYYDAVLGLMSESEQQYFKGVSTRLGLYSMPYAGNGKYDVGEPYLDENKNGVHDGVEEPYYDENGNKKYDPPEPFTDENGNGEYDYDEPYDDLNDNGEYDYGESFADVNGNKVWDDCESYVDLDGDGKYSEGDTLYDNNGNGKYDEGELFYDLIYKWEEPFNMMVVEDPKKYEANKDKVVYGKVADYKRSSIRNDTPYPDIGYLSIGAQSGVELPDYYLVKIDIPNEGTYTSLRRSHGNRIFLFDPQVTNAGTVTVSIPGGEEIYSGDISYVGSRAIEMGSSYDAALAYVISEKLADPNVIAVPTYGAKNASGYALSTSALGDVDNDGAVTSADALMILRASINLTTLTTEQKEMADMDLDESITSADALAVLRESIGIG